MASKNREITNPPEVPVAVAGEDLISSLLDDIITHILSYIPTKASVATAVLSKRWNRIWISVPNLDFGTDNESDLWSPGKKSAFIDFVDRVLSLNKSVSVRKVHLYCHDDGCKTRADAWMRSLLVRVCEEFRVELATVYSMPDCFFNQNNLVELTLGNVVLKVPPSVCFPRLKTIELYYVQFLDDDDDSMKNLMSGCPVLTRSSFRGILKKVCTLHICSSTLKHLNLHVSYSGSEQCIVIDAPKLTDLVLMDEDCVNYDTINLPSLVCADLTIWEENQAAFDEKLFKLLRKISHVNELAISSAILHSMELENLPIYQNLTKLTVGMYVHYNCSGLPNLFHSTPNLVTFILDLSLCAPCGAWYQTNDHVPRCFLASLEHVTISLGSKRTRDGHGILLSRERDGSEKVIFRLFWIKRISTRSKYSCEIDGDAKELACVSS